MPTSLINITCGYVESSRISHVIFTSDTLYDTQFEALSSLSLQLFREWWGQVHSLRLNFQKECCKEAIANNPGSWSWCPVCRKGLASTPSFGEFTKWISSFHGACVDGYGYIESPWGLWDSWDEILSIPREEHLLVPENAEHVIPRALPLEELSEEEAETWRSWYIAETSYSKIYDHDDWPTDVRLTLDHVAGRRMIYLKSVIGEDFE